MRRSVGHVSSNMICQRLAVTTGQSGVMQRIPTLITERVLSVRQGLRICACEASHPT